jgi:hypothetical protein
VGHYSGALLLPAIIPEIAKLMFKSAASAK